MADEVVLLGFWASSFSMRVRIALAEKGVEYVYKEQDLVDKSELLLQMNPIHKKIPVLIHNGKPICESLIIIQYIDEVWKDKCPLLSSDPYLKAQARFWGDYIDKKIYDCGRRVMKTKIGVTEQEREEAKKEFIDIFRLLEEQLGDEPYFGGNDFGFVDVALIPFYSWFHAFETFGDLKIEDSCPKIIAWAKRCMQKESVSESLADPHKIHDFVLELKRRLGNE